MSFRFLVCMPLLFQAIINGLPLDQLENSNSFGLWDDLDLSIEEAVPGNLDVNFPLGTSENAGYDIFVSEIPVNTDGFGSQLEEPIFPNDVNLIAVDYTENSPDFFFTEENSQTEISGLSDCAFQARKRDGLGDILSTGR